MAESGSGSFNEPDSGHVSMTSTESDSGSLNESDSGLLSVTSTPEPAADGAGGGGAADGAGGGQSPGVTASQSGLLYCC